MSILPPKKRQRHQRVELQKISNYYTVLCCQDQKSVTVSGEELEILGRKLDRNWIDCLYSRHPDGFDTIQLVIKMQNVLSSTLELVLSFLRQNAKQQCNIHDLNCWSRKFFGQLSLEDLTDVNVFAFEYKLNNIVKVCKEIFDFMILKNQINDYPDKYYAAFMYYETLKI